MFLRKRPWRTLIKDGVGVSLVEAAVAVALLGIIGVAFAIALAGSTNGRVVADEHAASRELAESVMENIKQQEFASSYNASASVLEEYPGYAVTANATSLGSGKQKITVTVSRRDRDIHVLEGYKVDR